MSTLQLLAAEGPNGRFLPGDVLEFWWGLLAFLVVFGLLAWKVFPLVKKALDQGQADAVADATAAEDATAEAQAKIAATRAELGDPAAESERIIAEARESAQQLRVDSNARTQQMVNDAWTKAQSDVSAMKVQANADMQAEVAAQAVGAAEQVVRSSLDAGGHGDLIESYISQLGASS